MQIKREREEQYKPKLLIDVNLEHWKQREREKEREMERQVAREREKMREMERERDRQREKEERERLVFLKSFLSCWLQNYSVSFLFSEILDSVSLCSKFVAFV